MSEAPSKALAPYLERDWEALRHMYPELKPYQELTEGEKARHAKILQDTTRLFNELGEAIARGEQPPDPVKFFAGKPQEPKAEIRSMEPPISLKAALGDEQFAELQAEVRQAEEAGAKAWQEGKELNPFEYEGDAFQRSSYVNGFVRARREHLNGQRQPPEAQT